MNTESLFFRNHQNGGICGNHGVNPRLFRRFAEAPHGIKLLIEHDRIDRQPCLNAAFMAHPGNQRQVLLPEIHGRTRPHIQRTDAEINGIRPVIQGGAQRFKIPGGSQQQWSHTFFLFLIP